MATKIKKKTKNNSNGPSLNSIRMEQSFKAVFLAFIVGIILILATGQGSQIIIFFKGFLKDNFSNVNSLTNFLSRLSYFVPLGLSLAVAFRMGLFNIGAAGQAMGGGAFAFYLSTWLSVGKFGWIFTLIGGIAFGMIVALIIAFLKNKFKINEVISSIMLNWILFYFMLHLSASGVSTPLENNDLRMDWLNDFFDSLSNDIFIASSSSLNIGVLFFIPLVIILAIVYKKTKWGFKQELIGSNPATGKYLGIKSKNEIYKTLALSGALAGLAGTIYFLGVKSNLPAPAPTHDIPAWTFDGITIALLGFSSPIGVLGSSIIYAAFNPEIDNLIGKLGIINIMVAVMIISIASSNYRIKYGKRKQTIFIPKQSKEPEGKVSEKSKIKKENTKLKKEGGK